MAKRKNAGFKGAKEVRISNNNISIGPVREPVVKLARTAWNNLPKDYDIAKREVKVISIYKAASSQDYVGTMYKEEQKLVLRDINVVAEWYYENTIVHELAHAWYNRQSRLNPELIEKWNKALEKINKKPLNEYVKTFKDEWKFSTESHSAVAELVDVSPEAAAKHRLARPLLVTDEEFQHLRNIYLEIHGRL